MYLFIISIYDGHGLIMMYNTHMLFHLYKTTRNGFDIQQLHLA